MAVHRNLGRVHIQHDALRGIEGYRFADQFAVDAGQAAESSPPRPAEMAGGPISMVRIATYHPLLLFQLRGGCVPQQVVAGTAHGSLGQSCSHRLRTCNTLAGCGKRVLVAR